MKKKMYVHFRCMGLHSSIYHACAAYDYTPVSSACAVSYNIFVVMDDIVYVCCD